MKLRMTIENPKIGKRQFLNFPATYSAIEDVLFQLQCDETVDAYGSAIDGYQQDSVPVSFTQCDIFSLNYLAEITQSFRDEDTIRFIGAYCIMQQNEQVNLEKAINLAMNIQRNNKVLYQPAQNEYELAEYYLEYELLPELEGVSDDVYEWIMDHTDLQELGEEICEKEHGIFVHGAYVTMETLEDLYDGVLRMPDKEQYVFQLEVGWQQDDGDNQYRLSLPASNDEIYQMTKAFDAELSQLMCDRLQSIVPKLETLEFTMAEVETLNQLATSIDYFKESGTLNTYKAMVDTFVGDMDIETAWKLCEHVDAFDLQEDIRNYAEYGRSKFTDVLPVELLACFNTEECGEKFAKKNGVTITNYGALVPKDGVSLHEKLEQEQEEPEASITMEQSM